MRQSQDIYNDIGSVLIAAAPDSAAKIIARAELSPEGDHCNVSLIMWTAPQVRQTGSLLAHKPMQLCWISLLS